MKKVSVAIGIPTYEAGEGLIKTLNSIYQQSYFSNLKKVLLVVDGNKISKNILNEIKNKKLQIKYFRARKGQSSRINDILSELTTDIIILTNDDVILEKEAVKNLVLKLLKTKSDLCSGHELPLTNRFLAKVMEIGYLMSYSTKRKWNKFDNYLSYNGRLLGLSGRFAKNLRIPENNWNNDTYMYLYAKINKFRFFFSEDSLCYYQPPSNLKEYANQSIKYQKSEEENQKYFKTDISRFYKIPKRFFIESLISVFSIHPIYTSIYLGIFLYSRVANRHKTEFIKNRGYWDTDKSTKLIGT